jgi:hypothetical protein
MLWRSRIIGVSVQLQGFVAQGQSKLAVSIPKVQRSNASFPILSLSWEATGGVSTSRRSVAMTSTDMGVGSETEFNWNKLGVVETGNHRVEGRSPLGPEICASYWNDAFSSWQSASKAIN